MVKNYIKIALRSILKDKFHSLISIIGLAVGLACCILIYLFVKDEITFDNFHTKSDRIYRSYVFEDYGPDEQFFNTVSPVILATTLKENFEEIESYIHWGRVGDEVKRGETSFNEVVYYTGNSFFEMFDFEIKDGVMNGKFESDYDLIITETIAEKYFGKNNPIGQTLEIRISGEFKDFTIKAVYYDVPSNSSLQFQFLISDVHLKDILSPRAMASWYSVSLENYFLLPETVDPKEIESKIPSMLKTVFGDRYKEGEYTVGFQKISDIHLNPEYPIGLVQVSDPQYSIILSAIALLILFVGSINFMTLSIGKSLNRAKEVGVRKVVGARKIQLVYQFLGEAIIVSLFSLVIGFVLAMVNLPLFNDLAGKNLSLDFTLYNFAAISGLAIFIGLVSGSYPALIISRFKPVKIIKGDIKLGSNKQLLRKIMVGFQFVLSVLLIGSTLAMKKQITHLQSMNLGFDKEQIMVVQMNASGRDGLRQAVDKGFELTEQFKTKLSGTSSIKSMAAATQSVGTGGWTNIGFTDVDDNYQTFDVQFADRDYLNTMDIQLLIGRNFSEDNPSDGRRSILVNEALVKAYGWSDPLGKKLPGKGFEDHEIIGIVKDFNYNSLHSPVQPLVISISRTLIFSGTENIGIPGNIVPKLLVKIKEKRIQEAIQDVSAVWKELMGGEEFSYTFIDQALANQYEQEENLGKIVSISSILAIIIACFGLLGLASLTLANRVKEISLRKILGASQQTILVMISKDYIFIVFLALIIASPITYFFVEKWLENFEYKINLGLELFLMAGALSIFIAMFTISYQAIKASIINPVDALKYE